MNEKAVYALEQARELVRMGWCQGVAAKDAHGRGTHVHNNEDNGFAPVQFDLMGAVARATWPWEEGTESGLWRVTESCCDYLAAAVRDLYGWDMADHPYWHLLHEWNDTPGRTVDEVVELYGRAIELAREEK